MGYPTNNGQGVLFTYLNQTNNYMVYQPESEKILKKQIMKTMTMIQVTLTIKTYFGMMIASLPNYSDSKKLDLYNNML